MAIKRKRKKSLLGWMYKNWKLKWDFDAFDYVSHGKIYRKKSEFGNEVKVRITIEEV